MRQQQHPLTFKQLREEVLADIDDCKIVLNLMQEVLDNKLKIPTYFTYAGYINCKKDHEGMLAEAQLSLAMLQGMED